VLLFAARNSFSRRCPISHPKSNKSAARTANGVFEAWEKRTALVKTQMNAESAASDAKTARLRALRLAKEAEDNESARIAAANSPPLPVKKRVKRGT
jgi:hypothetical protein